MSVELVFVHGWGFNANFWNPLVPLLPQFRQSRVDLGFFGPPSEDLEPKTGARILIGHSLGFLHGLKSRRDWDGWIAINGFTRFASSTRNGCVAPQSLRAMRVALQSDPAKVLRDFYQLIGAKPAIAGAPSLTRLTAGLDELRDLDGNDILSSFDISGLALAGRLDPLVPLGASEELGQKAQGGGLAVHDEAGHLLPETDPSWCARLISQFLATYFD